MVERIPRGGLIPAVRISHLLKLPMIVNNNILYLHEVSNMYYKAKDGQKKLAHSM